MRWTVGGTRAPRRLICGVFLNDSVARKLAATK